MKPVHLSLAVVLGSALLAVPAVAQGAGRLDPPPPSPVTAPPPVPVPPVKPPNVDVVLSEAPRERPASKNPPLVRPWTYPALADAVLIYPTDMTSPLWMRQDMMAAHDMRGGIPAPPVEHKVILRDGVMLAAREAPVLAGGTVRFANPRGLLVSVRAADVDLPATAAANELDWPGSPPAPPPAAEASAPPAPLRPRLQEG